MSNQKLNGVVMCAPNKSFGFDVDSKMSLEKARQFYQDGYRFCLRYLSRKSEESRDLTYEEASAILEGGLALMPVQHVLNSGWYPNADLGKEYGENAAVNADTVGFPPGVNVWCDLEGIKPGTPAQDVIDYCNAWYDAVAAKKYLPGLYVGANSILNGEQLYHALKFKHYWKSASRVHNVPTRGYQMIQTSLDENVHGCDIDKDITYVDSEGGSPHWLINRNFINGLFK